MALANEAHSTRRRRHPSKFIKPVHWFTCSPCVALKLAYMHPNRHDCCTVRTRIHTPSISTKLMPAITAHVDSPVRVPQRTSLPKWMKNEGRSSFNVLSLKTNSVFTSFEILRPTNVRLTRLVTDDHWKDDPKGSATVDPMPAGDETMVQI